MPNRIVFWIERYIVSNGKSNRTGIVSRRSFLFSKVHTCQCSIQRASQTWTWTAFKLVFRHLVNNLNSTYDSKGPTTLTKKLTLAVRGKSNPVYHHSFKVWSLNWNNLFFLKKSIILRTCVWYDSKFHKLYLSYNRRNKVLSSTRIIMIMDQSNASTAHGVWWSRWLHAVPPTPFRSLSTSIIAAAAITNFRPTVRVNSS